MFSSRVNFFLASVLGGVSLSLSAKRFQYTRQLRAQKLDKQRTFLFASTFSLQRSRTLLEKVYF